MGRINCGKFTKFFVAINENEKKNCLKYFNIISSRLIQSFQLRTEKVFLSITDRKGGKIMIMNSGIELIKKKDRKIINK